MRINNVWQRKTGEVWGECCWLGGESTSYSKSQSCLATASLQFSVGLVCPSPKERQLCSNMLHPGNYHYVILWFQVANLVFALLVYLAAILEYLTTKFSNTFL